MADGDTSKEDFEKFVRDNREMILRILNEEKKDDRAEEVRSHVHEIHEDIESTVRNQVHDGSMLLLKVLSDSEVQKHFFTGMMEMMLCFESVFAAFPSAEGFEDVAEQAEKAKSATMRAMAFSGAKVTVKDKVDDIKTTAKENLEKIDIKVKKRFGKESGKQDDE